MKNVVSMNVEEIQKQRLGELERSFNLLLKSSGVDKRMEIEVPDHLENQMPRVVFISVDIGIPNSFILNPILGV